MMVGSKARGQDRVQRGMIESRCGMLARTTVSPAVSHLNTVMSTTSRPMSTSCLIYSRLWDQACLTELRSGPLSRHNFISELLRTLDPPRRDREGSLTNEVL